MWLLKLLGKSGYQRASVWNVRNGEHIYDIHLDTLPGLQWLQPAHQPAKLAKSPTIQHWCGEATAQRLGRAQPAVISAALTVCCEYLNLKWFHSYSFKECTYLLTKTFIQIFNLLFLKISGRAAAFQPLWTNYSTFVSFGLWCQVARKTVYRGMCCPHLQDREQHLRSWIRGQHCYQVTWSHIIEETNFSCPCLYVQ